MHPSILRPMQVSVIIPTYNRKNDIKDCLDALERQTFSDFDVIVVDGGSKDGTNELLKGRKGRFNLSCYIERKKGAGAARNTGVMKTDSRFIAFTDDDCLPEPDWLASLVGGIAKGERLRSAGRA